MSDERTILDDLPDLDDAPFEEVDAVLTILAEAEDPGFRGSAREVRGLLLDRALNLLRTGSRTEIADESCSLHRFLDSPAGESLRAKAPEVHGGFRAVADLLSGAADRADDASVDSILRNHKGRGQQILEAVAAHGQGMPRSLLRSRLGLSESHLSHVLRELQEADLIVRCRPGKGKEVVVDLAHVGREVVDLS